MTIRRARHQKDGRYRRLSRDEARYSRDAHGRRAHAASSRSAVRRSPLNQPLDAHWDPVGAPRAASGYCDDPEPADPQPVRRRRSDRAEHRRARSAGSRARRRVRSANRQSAAARILGSPGWRACAIPAVALLIVGVTVFSARGGEEGGESGAGGDSASVLLDGGVGQDGEPVPPPADGAFPELPAGVLPDGGPFTEHGTGSWRVMPGGTAEVGAGEGRFFTYTVEIEEGIDTSSYGGDESFTRMVDETLANPKSWIADRQFGFRRISAVEDGEPDFRVSLTSVMTVRQFCGYTIQLEVSCYSPRTGRVIINDARWVRGALAFQGDIGSYRQYLINHEVGHAIGYPDHVPCETDGGLANVMMQQTLSTANDEIALLDPGGVVPADGKVCGYNPWPYPRGAQ
ncbi:DUF3152 domain-containing protein [Hoyosella sp. YIM 151337]|uniref:DUF3152 domain-containing protein n=1 Tax=Hoyosella sp. YIM 151337 TaxID=2992742 RepID=UPI002235F3F6|nr:DUF3152 domain-containing protein [Hoyosella sp. YIM 151337]MCW4352276.1 DUF3152 domain-containing protein [Hoyosella sp. YIM 151337]